MSLAFLPLRVLPAAVSLACAALPAIAQQSTSTGRSLWEVGAVGFGVDQQAYPGSGRQVRRALALPYLIYRGQYLRADNDGVGVRPVKTPLYEFDVTTKSFVKDGFTVPEAKSRVSWKDKDTLYVGTDFGRQGPTAPTELSTVAILARCV